VGRRRDTSSLRLSKSFYTSLSSKKKRRAVCEKSVEVRTGPKKKGGGRGFGTWHLTKGKPTILRNHFVKGKTKDPCSLKESPCGKGSLRLAWGRDLPLNSDPRAGPGLGITLHK